ncbi:MAG: DUF2264 domain-containing protein, partial [Rikenellaceae bacterium]
MRREEWVDTLYKVVTPILERSATGQLRAQMPHLQTNHDDQYLESIGRVICGVAPWIESRGGCDKESLRRAHCFDLIIKTLESITDESSADYISFTHSHQSLVDSAYLAQGLLRAPSIWGGLSGEVRCKIVASLQSTRRFKPADNNWLLFASMVEAFMLSIGEKYDSKRLWRGVKSFDSLFYMGDGLFGDGVTFSMDYYNSYVIHPMMMDVLRVCTEHKLPQAEALYR